MIKSFRHRGLKRLYDQNDRSGIAPHFVEKIERVLARLDEADAPQVMNIPGYRLHPLKGDYRGFWSVTVGANWRIIFRFADGHAHDVELIDYH